VGSAKEELKHVGVFKKPRGWVGNMGW